ncbi:MAG: hypothetical protein QW303_09305 [Nitrososphaerota archaeon]
MEITEREILEYFNFIWTEADSYFNSRVKPDWDENYRLYTDAYEFQNKLRWQARIKDPIADNLVTRMANFLTRILISVEGDYFDILHNDKARAQGYKDLVGTILNDNNFPVIFNETLKHALVTSIYVNKVSYTYSLECFPLYNTDTKEFSTQEKTVGRVRIDRVSPWDIRLDPAGDSYIIEIKELDIADFRQLAIANRWMNTDRVLMQTLSPVMPSDSSKPALYRPKITLYYVYTKALTNKSGKILDDNVHFIVANKQHVIWYEKNLLPNGRFPYVVGQPLKSLVGRYGRSYLSKLKSVIMSYLESLNLILDSFQLATLGTFEYDVSAVVTDASHTFTARVEPGRFYPVNRPNSIRQIFNANIPAISLQMLFYLDRVIQNRSFQTEFLQGMPTVKGRPTASEISIKTQESSNFFTDIASEIERNIITPLIELVLATELIYMDDEFHVELLGNIKSLESFNLVKSLPFNDRIADYRESKITAKGLSGKILKSSNLNKLLQIVSVLGNMPQLLQALDSRKFLTELFYMFDMMPDELFNLEALTPEERR